MGASNSVYPLATRDTDAERVAETPFIRNNVNGNYMLESIEHAAQDKL